MLPLRNIQIITRRHLIRRHFTSKKSDGSNNETKKELLKELDAISGKKSHTSNTTTTTTTTTTSSSSSNPPFPNSDAFARPLLEKEKTWSESIRQLLRVGRPQLINIVAMFACVVMAMQSLGRRKEVEALKVDLEKVEEQMKELKKTLVDITDESFATNVAERAVDAAGYKNEKGTSTSSWFSRTTATGDNITIEHVVTSVKDQVDATVGDILLTDKERQERMEERMLEALAQDATRQLDDNTTSDSNDSDEVVIADNDKQVVKRRKKMTF